jgi:hypothetical protein
MKTSRFFLVGLFVGLSLLWYNGALLVADPPIQGKAALHLITDQKEFLSLEPILATVRIEGISEAALPPGPSKGTLRFEAKPALKARANAKPLPLEAQGADLKVPVRRYDLLEWFDFPAKGGTWTVQAVFEHKGTTVTSTPISITVTRPSKGDAEFGPVDRLHHIPWSNYTIDAFCGDTQDVVKRWPESRLAKYCHYWNGRFFQHKKEYDKALASYREVVKSYPNFVLCEDAQFGVAECLVALGKLQEGKSTLETLQSALKERGSVGRSVVQGLTEELGRRLKSDTKLQLP